jgi:hypothetical protein
MSIGSVLLELPRKDDMAILKISPNHAAPCLFQLGLIIVLHLMKDDGFRLSNVNLRLKGWPFRTIRINFVQCLFVDDIFAAKLLQLEDSILIEIDLFFIHFLYFLELLSKLSFNSQQLIFPSFSISY